MSSTKQNCWALTNSCSQRRLALLFTFCASVPAWLSFCRLGQAAGPLVDFQMRTMRMVARALLPCCVGLFSACAAHAQPAEVLALPQEVALHPTISNAVGRGDPCVLQVRVSTREEVTEASFLLDTGSTVTILSKSFERWLGPRVGRRRLATPFNQNGSNSELANEYAAPTFHLRNVALNTGATVLTSDNTRWASGCQGTLGMDCLKNYCVQLDFAAGKLRFLDARALKGNGLGTAFALKYVGRMAVVSMNVFDGRTLRFVLDTGFYQPAAGTLPPALIRSALASGAAKDIGGGIFSFETIDIGGETYSTLSFARTQVGDEGIDGFIGLPFLARHVVTLDFPNQTMYLKRWNTADDEHGASPNPQGRANGRQPNSSETNRTSAAAASRRSP